MVENTAVKTVTNISNGIVLQVADLPKMENRRKNRREEISTHDHQDESLRRFIVVFIAETLGTGCLMFLGCMGCISQVDDPPAIHHLSGLCFGFTVLIIIQCIGHISSAHLNPAVTITALMLKTISPLMGVNYVIAQFFGAVAGFSLLRVLMPAEYVSGDFCMTLVNPKMTVTQGLFLEICITAILTTVVSAIWDKRNANWGDSVAIKFGCVITVISMVAGPFTGASMNTVRSLAPAIYSGNWKNNWIYWLGPNLGAVLGTGTYILAFGEPTPKKEEEDLPLDSK